MVNKLLHIIVGSLIGAALFVVPVQAAVPPASEYGVQLSAANTQAGSTASNRFKSSWSWYISRASGILAAILLGLLIASGVGLLTGVTYRLLEPLPAWAAHRAIGLAFGVVTAVHVAVLLFDKFVGFSVADLLIPFYSDYKPLKLGGLELGSVYMASGILAFYAIIAIIISSLLWMQKKPKPWRLLHYLSYAAMALVFVHALFLGTDIKHGVGRVLWILAAVGLLVLIATRLRRAHTIRKVD